jgi:hypothetical protein
LEDAIENRQNTAGFIFAQGAANQRAAQLKSLEDQLAVDKKRARTEKERLSVEKRRLQIEDGWTYFLHGWTRVMADVFNREIPTQGPLFEELGRIAAGTR